MEHSVSAVIRRVDFDDFADKNVQAASGLKNLPLIAVLPPIVHAP